MSQTLSNIGKKWTDEEVIELLKGVRRKESITQLAIKHGRTYGGISSRLRQLAADYYFNDNRSIEDIQKFTGLDKESIADVISRRQWAMDQKEKKIELKPATNTTEPEVKKEGMISILTEIREMMREMLEIMKGQNQ